MIRRHLAFLAAAALAAPAAAEDFTILIYEPAQELALRRDSGPAGQAYWAAYAAYAGELAKAGAVRGGAALQTAPDPAGPRCGRAPLGGPSPPPRLPIGAAGGSNFASSCQPWRPGADPTTIQHVRDTPCSI
jgi:hypothetical protein